MSPPAMRMSPNIKTLHDDVDSVDGQISDADAHLSQDRQTGHAIGEDQS
jgi:hypothetical protein